MHLSAEWAATIQCVIGTPSILQMYNSYARVTLHGDAEWCDLLSFAALRAASQPYPISCSAGAGWLAALRCAAPGLAMVYDGARQHVLAPMVRVNTLPFRLLCLEYGADLVYSEELVARSLAETTRRLNPTLNSVDWVKPSSKPGVERLVLRVAPELEANRLVVQLGAADAVPALEAARTVADHVAAVDLNMGCPVHFSTSGGMGAALLQEPDRAADILSTLRRNLTVPVTAKIRLLDSPEDTVELARRLQSCGVSALAVHCRQVHHRSHAQPALWDWLSPVVDALDIPVVANGDVFSYDDFERVCTATGCHSVMAARGALWNPSIFCDTGNDDLLRVVIPRYVALSASVCNHPMNTKSVVLDMLDRKGAKSSRTRHAAGRAVTQQTSEMGATHLNSTSSAQVSAHANTRRYERVDDGLIEVDEAQVFRLLDARAAHKDRREWAEADAIQMQLRVQHSVRINDRDQQWSAVGPDGRCGKRRAGHAALHKAVSQAKNLQDLQRAVDPDNGLVVQQRRAPSAPSVESMAKIEAAIKSRASGRETVTE